MTTMTTTMRNLLTDLELKTYNRMSLEAACAAVEEGTAHAKEALHTQYLIELRRCDNPNMESCDKALVAEMYEDILADL